MKEIREATMYVLSVVEGTYGTENYCLLSLVCCVSEIPFICISDHKQFCPLIHKLLTPNLPPLDTSFFANKSTPFISKFQTKAPGTGSFTTL